MALAKITGNEAADLAKDLLYSYFKTQSYPFTRHHLNSYDQFLKEDMIRIVQSQNPILLLKDLIPGIDPLSNRQRYRYKIEIFIGGEDGTGFHIGSPTINRFESTEVRLLYPNEARLRNLTYSATVFADVFVRISRVVDTPGKETRYEIPEDKLYFRKTDEKDERLPLFQIPIMLHSQYCVLHNKPAQFLREVGECEYDYGGYFIVNGAEKVLITHQEQSFNTLYTDLITPKNIMDYNYIQKYHQRMYNQVMV
jgi:DNA-directed RNA polymerase II subunit RPB2